MLDDGTATQDLLDELLTSGCVCGPRGFHR